MSELFGFMVDRVSKWDQEARQSVVTDTWCVWLPHQCGAWEIAGEDGYEGMTQDEAAAELERFIAEAQRALAALRLGESFGVSSAAA